MVRGLNSMFITALRRERSLIRCAAHSALSSLQGTPQTFWPNDLHFEWAPSAYAQVSELADQIADIVKKMPDVVSAYRQMGQRLPQTERLPNISMQTAVRRFPALSGKRE